MHAINLIIEPAPDNAEEAEIYVDGEVGGRPYRFLLDTGAATSSLVRDPYIARFDSLGTHDTSGVFAAVTHDLIMVPDITVGPIAHQDFALVRSEAGPGIKSLVGMDLLKDFCCHFLFDEHRLWVNAEGFSASNGAFESLYLDRKFHPYVDIHVEDNLARAVWDTGASITLVDLNFVNRLPDFFEEVGVDTGTDAAGMQQETPVFMMVPITLGGRVFPSQRVVGVDLSAVNARIERPMDLILGYNTLRQANWLFDFPGKRWAISKWLGEQ